MPPAPHTTPEAQPHYLRTTLSMTARAMLLSAVFMYTEAIANDLPHTSDQSEISQQVTTTTPTETIPVTVPVSLETITPSTGKPETSSIKSFDQFRSPEPLPPRLKELMAEKTVAIKGLGLGTGMLVNGYLISAAHVAVNSTTGEGSSSLSYSRWQSAFEPELLASTWIANTDIDVLVAKLPDDADTSQGWYVPVFANEAPPAGRRFAIAGLPGDAKKPVTANLTFLGVNNPDDLHNQYVFTVDPDNNNPESVRKACMFGASGSIIMDGYGNLATLTGVHYKYPLYEDAKKDDAWDEQMLLNSQKFGVDLSQSSLICYATPITRDLINLNIAALK